MKVAVITRHAITNYGSILQSIATQKMISKLGHSSVIINYIREDENYKNHEKTLLNRKSSWNNNFFKRTIYLILRQPFSVYSGKRFEKYQKDYLKLTDLCTNKNEIENECTDVDVFMTGSDQVWGPMENGEYDDAYCLSFVGNNKKKIAYAASLGRTDMNDDLRSYFKHWLSRYTKSSVIEDSAVEILDSLGIQADQVLDPTLMLGRDEWKEFLDKDFNKGKYILVYQLHNDEKLSTYAKKVSEKTGMPLIRISASFHQLLRGGKFQYLPTINEFLSYIDNAECLITDSFHGTAFAINLNTTFVEVLPNNKTGTRNLSILRLTHLEDRILTDINDVGLAKNKIDYTKVNKILKEKQIESMKILKNMIED
mgnify:FL=1